MNISGLPFVKMHGLGNDFVIIDSRETGARMFPSLAKAIGDRHFGVGFDQLAEIRVCDEADIALDFWNSDGTRAGACGNATRCAAKLLLDETGKEKISIRTERGVLYAIHSGELISVNMGHPQLEWDQIPLSHEMNVEQLPLDGAPTAVGMGNPHAVFIIKDINDIDVASQGAQVETNALFPERTNVEFAEVRNRNEIRMRVWERGAGITLACGSGACATLVATSLQGLTEKKVDMEVDGGWLHIEWCEDGVWMSGPTQFVFEATLAPNFIAQAASHASI